MSKVIKFPNTGSLSWVNDLFYVEEKRSNDDDLERKIYFSLKNNEPSQDVVGAVTISKDCIVVTVNDSANKNNEQICLAFGFQEGHAMTSVWTTNKEEPVAVTNTFKLDEINNFVPKQLTEAAKKGSE